MTGSDEADQRPAPTNPSPVLSPHPDLVPFPPADPNPLRPQMHDTRLLDNLLKAEKEALNS